MVTVTVLDRVRLARLVHQLSVQRVVALVPTAVDFNSLPEHQHRRTYGEHAAAWLQKDSGDKAETQTQMLTSKPNVCRLWMSPS